GPGVLIAEQAFQIGHPAGEGGPLRAEREPLGVEGDRHRGDGRRLVLGHAAPRATVLSARGAKPVMTRSVPVTTGDVQECGQRTEQARCRAFRGERVASSLVAATVHGTSLLGGRGLRAGLPLAIAAALSFGMSGAWARGLIDAGWTPGAAVTVRVWVAALVLLVPAVIALRGRWRLLRRNLGMI